MSPAYGILAVNRGVLLDALRNNAAVKAASLAGVPVIQITLPCCEASKVYQHLEDVPSENVGPCECGNWFIYYKESA